MLVSSHSWSERADDPCARRAVAAQVAGVVVGDRDLVAVARDRDGTLDGADERMVELDAAVEDADAYALPVRAAPGPLARHALRPRRRQRDRLVRAGGEAPRGKVVVVLVRDR